LYRLQVNTYKEVSGFRDQRSLWDRSVG